MCGIAGLIHPRLNGASASETMVRMLRAQQHRGPDFTGTWTDGSIFLGHNRLSIIDLSDAARQPMEYRKKVLVFNGEIYNYIELKKELEGLGHRFYTTSDSEVLLHAYDQWGAACTAKFVGMWAFVIWDSEREHLFASRDRFGIKPFYYIHEGDYFYFASEINTLKMSPLFSSELNISQVSRSLQMGWLGYHDETFYSKVKALPAAHQLDFSKGSLSVSRYWDVGTGKNQSLAFDEKRDAFRQLFTDSIRLHLRSDVPVASCLSGGIDSSSIVSMVQHLNPGMKYNAFSIYYDGDGDVDERPFINEVLNKYPEIEPHYHSPSGDEIAEHFSHALHHADVPVTGSSFLSQYFLMKMIAKHGIRVVLDGQGADEYLGGYMHSFYRLIGGMLQRGRLTSALFVTSAVNHRLGSNTKQSLIHFGKSTLAALRDEQSLYALEYRNYFPFMTRDQGAKTPFLLKDTGGSRLDRFLYHMMFTTSLPSLLHYEDRNSMAFSIESRVPFLDHRLVEFCFSLNDEDRIHGVETKYLLRESMKGIIPDVVYARKDKKGFVTPGENKWLRGPLKFLLDSPFQWPDFIRADRANQLMDEYRRGDNSKALLIWRLVVLRAWLNR